MKVATTVLRGGVRFRLFPFHCSFRHWLCNTGDWGPSKCLLHHHPGLGHFLPEQLLHHWAPLGHLWTWMEHRYGLQGGSLCWSCWRTWNWGCVLVLETNSSSWPLPMSPDSAETGAQFCTGSGYILWAASLSHSWALAQELGMDGRMVMLFHHFAKYRDWALQDQSAGVRSSGSHSSSAFLGVRCSFMRRRS